MFRRCMYLGVLTVLTSSLLASTAWAQAGRAEISGAVFDQAKAVLPGATVTATNEATGVTRETVTGPTPTTVLIRPYPSFNVDQLFTNQVHEAWQAYQERRPQ